MEYSECQSLFTPYWLPQTLNICIPCINFHLWSWNWWMKAQAISRGLVHFRSESQSIIVIELLKYKGGSRREGRVPWSADWLKQEPVTNHVGQMSPWLHREHGKYANYDWLPGWSPSNRRRRIRGLWLDGCHGVHCQSGTVCWSSCLVLPASVGFK